MTHRELPQHDYPHRSLPTVTIWSLAAGVLLVAALAGPFLAGNIYTADDLGQFHLPIRAFYAQQLADRQSYDWMPQLFSGFYLTGEGQGGAYHPLHQLLYRAFPLQVALGLEYLIPYPVMMIGMWLMLRRRLGRNDVAIFGGLLFAFSSFTLLHFVHPNAVAIVAHVPWLLWAIDIVLTESMRRRVAMALVLIAMLTGSQILLGYPQYAWFSLVAEIAYATFLMVVYRKTPRTGCTSNANCHDCIGCAASTWPGVFIALGIGLLIGGIQFLPSIDAWLHSARLSADSSFAFWGSLHPLNVLQLVAPYMFAGRVLGDNTHEFGMYVGAVPLLLVVWMIARHRELGLMKPLAWSALGFAVVALWLSFGYYGNIYQLQTWLPVIGGFRFPCRYLVLFQLAVSICAAIGLALLIRSFRQARLDRTRHESKPFMALPRLRSRDFHPLWITAAVAVAVAVVGFKLRTEPYIGTLPAIAAGPAIFLAAAVLIVLTARGYALALTALILLTAVDLGYYGLSDSVFSRYDRLGDYVASASTPPADPSEGRVVGPLLSVEQPGVRMGDLLTLRGWQRADGYAGLEPKRQLDYHLLPALRVAGVRWVQRNPITEKIAGLVPRDDRWLEAPNPLPRARLVTKAVSSSEPAQDITKICPDTTALCEVPLAFTESTPGTASIVVDQPGTIAIDVECPDPQLLVLAEAIHPGWHVAIDDQPSQIYRVNGDFMGCTVPAGRHRVTFCFQPSSLRTGRLTSCLGLTLLTVCFIGLVYSPKPHVWKDDLS